MRRMDEFDRMAVTLSALFGALVLFAGAAVVACSAIGPAAAGAVVMAYGVVVVVGSCAALALGGGDEGPR